MGMNIFIKLWICVEMLILIFVIVWHVYIVMYYYYNLYIHPVYTLCVCTLSIVLSRAALKRTSTMSIPQTHIGSV